MPGLRANGLDAKSDTTLDGYAHSGIHANPSVNTNPGVNADSDINTNSDI
jgi:hypothetical protein